MQTIKVLLFLLLSGVASVQSMVVNTQSGPVNGSKVYYNGKSVKRFLGIPYAEPPVGNLRFKKTVPVKPWKAARDALTFPPSCLQIYPFDYPWVDQMSEKSEDCLYLNIWVPDYNALNSPKAVMFWAYSGGFSSGSGRLLVYDGQVLAAENDVIVVTINYRLGIFGFLSTESQEAPGNMGLFDVLEALKWVNENIGAFGGNPKSITVFGESAGSLTGGYLIVSPLSRGLFQKVIMESGAPNPQHINPKKGNSKLGQAVAKIVSCASNSSTIENQPCKVVRCLRKIDAEVLLIAVSSLTKTSITTFLPIYGEQFIPLHPYDALQRGYYQHADLLIGSVKDEGSVIENSIFPEVFGPYGEKNPQINKTFGRELIKENFQGIANGEKIADYYLNGLRETDCDTVRSQVYHSIGDYQLFCPDLFFALTYSELGHNVFSYYFYHRSNNTVFAPWMGVTHFSDVSFVFGRPLDNPSEYSVEEEYLSRKIMESWTNFAKYGSPSPTWKKFSSPLYYTEQIYISYNPDNYFVNHMHNCVFLKKYLFS